MVVQKPDNRNVNYRLERIREAAARTIRPWFDAPGFVHVVGAHGADEIVHTSDRIEFGRPGTVFRFNDDDSASRMADLLEDFFQDADPSPPIKRMA